MINAGAWSHYSRAIADALELTGLPAVKVADQTTITLQFRGANGKERRDFAVEESGGGILGDIQLKLTLTPLQKSVVASLIDLVGVLEPAEPQPARPGTADKPITALIRDLRERGMLDETLIIWGGEFGRTPFREGRTAASAIPGRDHYPDTFSIFLAGGGIKNGFSYGETNELGFSVAENKVHVHDLQATILHLLGLDHEKLTYRFQGRDFRLTDVHGNVVKDILA